MESYYDRLGDILRDKLASDEDPFDAWDPAGGKRREAGNAQQRVPRAKKQPTPRRTNVPDALISDYRLLGLEPGTAADECKSAWKKLLKKHHPDMHANSADEQGRATLMTRKLNESYKRIIEWLETDKPV